LCGHSDVFSKGSKFGGFLSHVPQIIQVVDEHFSIESHGDLGIPGIPHFKRRGPTV
jgi:hypothetical protein